MKAPNGSTSHALVIKVPSAVTLKKYGLDADQWLAILASQGGACAICRLVPSSSRLNIDHAHVKGWKKLPAEQRKQWVRGLCCFICNNRILTRGVTAAKLQAAADYLSAFANRIAGQVSQ